MPVAAPPLLRSLAREEWAPLAAEHQKRADALTAARRSRVARGETHPVDDFLYDYYGTRPSLLRRWHPGTGVTLADAPQHASWRWYTADRSGTRVDSAAFYAERGASVDWVAGLIGAMAERPLHLGCFGMHEWAMVYRSSDAERRHGLPLRLGADATDAVVESHPLTCTHYDAFRFFTADAVPRNATALTRKSQASTEQPGCLHATMDIFKWCARLAPAVPAGLTLDAFELAMEVRRVDMRASPYDVSDYGLAPIAVETSEGKREYAGLQREFADRGSQLRGRLLESLRVLRDVAGLSEAPPTR